MSSLHGLAPPSSARSPREGTGVGGKSTVRLPGGVWKAACCGAGPAARAPARDGERASAKTLRPRRPGGTPAREDPGRGPPARGRAARPPQAGSRRARAAVQLRGLGSGTPASARRPYGRHLVFPHSRRQTLDFDRLPRRFRHLERPIVPSESKRPAPSAPKAANPAARYPSVPRARTHDLDQSVPGRLSGPAPGLSPQLSLSPPPLHPCRRTSSPTP